MIVFTNAWMHWFILHVIHSKSVSAAWWLNFYSSKCFLQSPLQLGLGSGRGSSGACRRTAPIAGPPWVLGWLWSPPAATAYLRRKTTGAKWTYLRQGATQIQLTCLPPAFVTKRSVDWEWRDWQVLLLFLLSGLAVEYLWQGSFVGQNPLWLRRWKVLQGDWMRAKSVCFLPLLVVRSQVRWNPLGDKLHWSKKEKSGDITVNTIKKNHSTSFRQISNDLLFQTCACGVTSESAASSSSCSGWGISKTAISWCGSFPLISGALGISNTWNRRNT